MKEYYISATTYIASYTLGQRGLYVSMIYTTYITLIMTVCLIQSVCVHVCIILKVCVIIRCINLELTVPIVLEGFPPSQANKT